MNINTFVKLFSTKRTDDEKAKAVSDIMKNQKVKFSDKVDRCDIIAKQSYHSKEKAANGVERDTFKQNSAAKYMLYSLTLVEMYTKLDVDYKKSLEQFEMLNGEILDLIISKIDDRERKEFQMLLEFACDDLLVNEYEPHAFIRNQVDRFGDIVGMAILPALEGLDIEKVKTVIEQFSNISNN